MTFPMICPATIPKQSFWIKIKPGLREEPQLMKCLLFKHDRWFRPQHPHEQARHNRQTGKTDSKTLWLTDWPSLTESVSSNSVKSVSKRWTMIQEDIHCHFCLPSTWKCTCLYTHTHTLWQNDGKRGKYQLKMVYGKIVSETSMVK